MSLLLLLQNELFWITYHKIPKSYPSLLLTVIGWWSQLSDTFMVSLILHSPSVFLLVLLYSSSFSSIYHIYSYTFLHPSLLLATNSIVFYVQLLAYHNATRWFPLSTLYSLIHILCLLSILNLSLSAIYILAILLLVLLLLLLLNLRPILLLLIIIIILYFHLLI